MKNTTASSNARTERPVPYQQLSLPADVGGHHATLQQMADLANAITPALPNAQGDIAAQKDDIAAQKKWLEDFVDEIVRGLEEAAGAPQSQQPTINVSVVTGGEGNKSRQAHTESADNRTVLASIAALQRTLLMPVVPIKDANGEIVGAQRVESMQATSGTRTSATTKRGKHA